MPACWIRFNASSEPVYTQYPCHQPMAGRLFSEWVFLIMNTPPERPDTPCVAICSTTFDDICRGCGRTVGEVADWVFMTAEEKELVWQRILAQGYPRR